MPKRRLFYKNSYYHIYGRGIRRLSLFHDSWDYLYFTNKLSFYLREGGDTLIQQTLMPNHYHLIVKPYSKISISKSMQKTLMSYSAMYRRKYFITGYLYQGRFQSKWIKDQRYLLYLSRYIHRNPCSLPSVGEKKLKEYLWSSYLDYLNIRKKPHIKIDKKPVLKYFTNINSYESFCTMKDQDVAECINSLVNENGCI